ncbi:MAG TPA: DNA polymerase I [Alphaproteobacteria bacterium]|jgi:DNA polymerase-1|nr:DNA polymerase I [Alphaproteobacteria bacterium]
MPDTEIQGADAAQAQPAASALYLIDGSGFIFRAFHALPPMTRSDGTPVNAVLGFCNMLLKFLTEFGVARIAVIFDAKEENFRNEIYPLYKANRDAPPPELVPQFGLIREATEAFCLPSIELPGYEADDLIATYARCAVERGEQVVIVSSDKDMMQLIRPGVTMFDPMKSKPIGPPEVFEKFGVTPDKVVDIQSLAGDSTDNVPGVPGIGVKTAAQLITEFGDLDTLLARAGEIKQPKRRESLIEFAEQARISRRLVVLDAHAPVPVPIEDLKVHEPDSERLIAFLTQQEFRTTLARVQSRLRETGELAEGEHAHEGPGASPPVEVAYELVTDVAALDRWLARAATTGRMAFDVHPDIGQAVACSAIGIALAVAPGEACYIPLAHGGGAADGGLDLGQNRPVQLPLAAVLERLKLVMADPAILKIGHNAKFDAQILACNSMTVAPIDDTLLLSYVLDGASQDHGLAPLAERALGLTAQSLVELTGTGRSALSFDQLAPDVALPYAAQQVDLVLRLQSTLRARLVAERQVTLYERIDRPLVPVVAGMELAGIKVDRATLARLAQNFGERLQVLETAIYEAAGHPFNIGSPKQLGDVLFGEMGLPTTAGAKLKSGGWSTHADILEPLAAQGHDVAQKVLDWRALSKLKSTYADSLVNEIQGATGRVHTSYSLAATNTGRLSSIDPNLQNIPVRTEDGRLIRTAFIADEGNVLLSVDYSQIELRLAAEIAGIGALKQAFLDGDDIHALTASQVFGIPMAEMTRDIRNRAKAINFGIIYGISGFGLGQQLGVGAREAGEYIKQYLERFHELRVYMDETKSFARAHGYVLTLAGRKCYMPGIGNKIPSVRAAAERQAVNARIQGTAADIMKRAMIQVDRALKKTNSPARMLLSVHDELVFEVPEAAAPEAAELVKREMEASAVLGVPLVAEAHWAKNWAAAH